MRGLGPSVSGSVDWTCRHHAVQPLSWPLPAALPPAQRVKEANPGAGIGDIAKLLGAEWKALTAEQKAPYEERARADKVRQRPGHAKGSREGAGPSVSAWPPDSGRQPTPCLQLCAPLQARYEQEQAAYKASKVCLVVGG